MHDDFLAKDSIIDELHFRVHLATPFQFDKKLALYAEKTAFEERCNYNFLRNDTITTF